MTYRREGVPQMFSHGQPAPIVLEAQNPNPDHWGRDHQQANQYMNSHVRAFWHVVIIIAFARGS